MQWPNVQQLSPAKTVSTLLLLVVMLVLNTFTLIDSVHSKTSIWQINLASHQSLEQLKQIDLSLQDVAKQLQQHTEVSHQSAQQITAELVALQSAMEKLPSQQDVTNVQNTLTQIHQQLLKTNISTTHAGTNHKHHARPHRLSPKALPFRVVSIDIWNGTALATITHDGAPELLGKGDSFLGWKLTALSFDLEMAIFKNAHGQKVIVHVM